MAINFKPINEVPVAEALAAGDMLLVNSGGIAKQIDASKVGGGGGGGTIIYLKDMVVEDSGETASGVPCKDKEMTQIMSIAELLGAFASGPVVLFSDSLGTPAWIVPLVTVNMDNSVMSVVFAGSSIANFAYLCSDTAG